MTRILIPLLTFALFCCSCSKETLSDPDPDNKNRSAINFTALESASKTDTKGVSAIPTTAKVNISVYKRASAGDAQSFASAHISNKKYTVATAGTLTSGSKMYLNKGWYDIYAWGVYDGAELSSPEEIIYTNGNSRNLYRNRDYIFASVTPQTVTVNSSITADTNVPLTFKHCATKIVLNISADLGSIESYAIVPNEGVQFTPTDENSFLDYKTGVLTPTKTISGGRVNMTEIVANSQYEYIMLPLLPGETTRFIIIATVKVKGAGTQEMTFTATTRSATALVGGNIYTYNAVISATGISFSQATVTDWTVAEPIFIDPII